MSARGRSGSARWTPESASLGLERGVRPVGVAGGFWAPRAEGCAHRLSVVGEVEFRLGGFTIDRLPSVHVALLVEVAFVIPRELVEGAVEDGVGCIRVGR